MIEGGRVEVWEVVVHVVEQSVKCMSHVPCSLAV